MVWSATSSGTMKTPIARSSVVISVYRYDSDNNQTNAEMAPVVDTNGTWPSCIVCMPMTKVWASAARMSVSVATRPAIGLRLEKCTAYAVPAAPYSKRGTVFTCSQKVNGASRTGVAGRPPRPQLTRGA